METARSVSFCVAVACCLLSFAAEGSPVAPQRSLSPTEFAVTDLLSLSGGLTTASSLLTSAAAAAAAADAAAAEAAAPQETLKSAEYPVGPPGPLDPLQGGKAKIKDEDNEKTPHPVSKCVSEDVSETVSLAVSDAAADGGDTEWVQHIVEGQRLTLTAKAIGKASPSPPIHFLQQSSYPSSLASSSSNSSSSSNGGGGSSSSSSNLSDTLTFPVASVAAAAAPAAAVRDASAAAAAEETPEAGAPQGTLQVPLTEAAGRQRQLPARKRLEAPNQVQLMVAVEMMQQKTPVLYAFRWGKPGASLGVHTPS